MKRTFVLFMGGVLMTSGLCAQLTVGSSSTVKIKGQISTKGSVSIASAQADLSSTQIFLTGTNQLLSSSAPLVLEGLSVDGGGLKTLNGDWTISRDLVFLQGIVAVNSAKVLYTGATTLTGSTASFFNGTLFQQGAGLRFFPIGVGSTYMPMSLHDVQDAAEIGVTGFTTGANLTLPLDLKDIASNRYWQVAVINGSLSTAGASLYVPGSSIDASQQLVVVQADDANGATAINLGGGTTGDFVSSFSPVTKPILTIGIGEKVDLQIHDLISPYNGDDINDQLHIVNVEYTSENKVTLLDRWGVVVKQWTNFRNYDDPVNPNNDNFDFSKLSPGNYICVLEYRLTADSPKEEVSHMVTVLRGN